MSEGGLGVVNEGRLRVVNEGGLRVVKTGPLALVQDLGRFGYQHLGLSPGGAADEHAFLWANRLLENGANAPALEITLGGLSLQAEQAIRIALTGADLQARVNRQPVAAWGTYSMNAGDTLQFGYPGSGLRAYLAVQGGFEVPMCFGSVATVTREAIGGLDGVGSPLQVGDALRCAPSSAGTERRVPSRYIPDYRQPLALRVVQAARSNEFTPSALKRLYEATFEVSQQSDRMGVRLEGESVTPSVSGIVSEPVAFGTVQVPPDGKPIVLLKDRQTIGGYPKIGTVHPLDAFALAQRPPGAQVRFVPVSADDSAREWTEFQRFMRWA